ncbi:caspase, EACC1-associated type [Streptomyces anulatus]|uniref:caspase, EACC1-associated type n=1 Tax=Streptomyces anulatus TaxID=1892 RepID=UPI001C278EDD|nr:transporter substrate-binding domain-containing protein [Streptomyces anulatus]
MSVLPDPSASRAVLVGTSHYHHLEQLPAVTNNLHALAAHLSGPLSLRLPPQHVTVIENPAAAHTVVSEVRRAAAEATDTLIVYFAGHGLIDPQDTLSLALPHTESGRVETGLPYDWLRQVLLLDSRAERHVVILDCCYSGLALGRMSAASPGLADQASVEGSFLLAAAAETRTALAPVGDTHTAFTGALLDTLSRGIPGGPALLDMGAVYRHLRLTLDARGHPVPQARDRNNGAQVALGPNHAVLSDHTVLSDRTVAPDRSGRPGHTVRAGGKGTGRRHALIGTACATALALLAAGGYFIWDQQASQDSKPPAYGIEDSSILRRVKNHKGNKITIGVKRDQPGLSELVDPDRKVFKGFEIDLIKYLLGEIGFQGDIVFEPLFSGERETALKGNDVDLVIASYSPTPEREKEVDFSVPYYKTGQSLLMRKSHTKEGEVQTWDENAASRDVALVDMKINRIEDLPDGTDSCTVDSTSSEFMEENLKYKEKFDVQKKEASYKDCIEGLLDEGAVGSYEVISTDDVILAGLAYKYGNKKLVRPIRPFNPEEYAVGMKEGDPALKYLLCGAIKKSITEKSWEKYYNAHLKKIMLGKPANPPDEPSCEKRPSSPAAG